MKSKKLLALILVISIALGLCTGLVHAESPASILLQAQADAPTISFDGRVTEKEWGAPIGSWTADTIDPAWNLSGDPAIWTDGGKLVDREGKKVELYVRRDTDTMYLAVRMIHAQGRDTGITATAAPWNRAQLQLTIGTYDAATNIACDANTGNQKWMYYLINEKFDADGNFISDVATPGANKLNYTAPALKNFAIGWDEDTLTYTYEVAVPYVEGYLSADSDAVLSFTIIDAPAEGQANGVQWHISRAGQKRNANITSFKDYKPLHIAFSQAALPSHVTLTAMGQAPENIIVDGTVSEAEWGVPVGSFTADQVSSIWGSGAVWKANDSAADNANKRVEVFTRRDNENLYMAIRMVLQLTLSQD